MKPTKEQIKGLAHMALNTRPEEITCDEWLHLVARYAELEIAGKPIPPELQPVVEHLRLCAACMEELEALKQALNKDTPGG
jgi:hypothetical protein